MHGRSSHVREEQQVGTSCSGCKFFVQTCFQTHTCDYTKLLLLLLLLHAAAIWLLLPLDQLLLLLQGPGLARVHHDSSIAFLPSFLVVCFSFWQFPLSLSLSLSFFSFRSLPRSVYPFSTSVLSVLLDSGILSRLSLHIYLYIYIILSEVWRGNWVVSFYFFLAVSYHSCFFSSSLGAFMEEEGEANYLLLRLVASWKRKKKKQSIISYR